MCLPEMKTGFNLIIVFVDRLTKRAHFIPGKPTDTAEDFAKVFLREIYRLHGIPDSIVSDRDSKFISKFWKAFTKLLGTELNMSTAHHPETDGQTERTIRTLQQILRNYTNYHQDNWEELLPAVEFVYNDAIHDSTENTPFFADTGRHPRSLISVIADLPRQTQLDKTVTDLAKKIEEITQEIRLNIKDAQLYQKIQADKKR